MTDMGDTPDKSIAIACALLALCLARPDTRPSYSYGAPSFSDESHESESQEDFGPAKYEFNYAVKDDSSDNDFGHQETRDDELTEGTYFVHLPDGRLQKVVYFVDGDSGYVPEVTYEGEAHYPEPESIEDDSDSEADSSEERYVYVAPPPSLYGAPN
ncbi:uncharacterized protein LOC143037098 [Oratosquilla oratoria]|uniref:uncharacterized protein LOC143037098 n=1 Tax=Oratosquilla oratoria TaxID=337810 RepID=UPI003F76FDBB